MSAVLVTGGAGYIGSHMTYALLDRGEEVVVLDDLSTGKRRLVSENAKFVVGNVADRTLVRNLIQSNNIGAVIHFAGSSIVPESMERPLLYYENNTSASLALIEVCIEADVKHFVFSSTAAVYGTPAQTHVTEQTPPEPISPYGRSKLMTERILTDASNAHDFQHIALRYFNVAGADPKGRTGQSSANATHLIRRACQVALRRVPHLEIFGTNLPTSDGTGVRDYIHVADLVAIHLLALDALRAGTHTGTFNCGYGRGLTVRDIVASVERVAKCKLAVREASPRPGDPAMLVANCSLLEEALKWKPQHKNIDDIVGSAFGWESRLNA